MSDWKVIKTQIEIFPHPTADRLQIGKVGSYQVVVRTGQYKGGESIVFVPEKSILSGPALEFYREYLKGPESNRVGQIRLRGELSGGIIMPPELVRAQCGVDIDDLPCDQDLSELMHITKYVPPIPIEMAGVAVPIEYDHNSIKHDVEQHNTYAHNFVTGERVVITEKLHGSQLVAYLGSDDSGHTHRWVSTKNYNKQGLCLVETDTNFYWQATMDVGLWELMSGLMSEMSARTVQVFGEALPCQSLKYGMSAPTVRVFGVVVDGTTVPYDRLTKWEDIWVPILYDGPYENVDQLRKLALGNETLSGKNLHIKEGIVLRPYEDRRSADGTWLKTKVINKEYKETGEEFN